MTQLLQRPGVRRRNVLFHRVHSATPRWKYYIKCYRRNLFIREWFADFFTSLMSGFCIILLLYKIFCLLFLLFFVPVLSFLSNKFDCSLKLLKIGPRPIRSPTPMPIYTIGLYIILEKERKTQIFGGKFKYTFLKKSTIL